MVTIKGMEIILEPNKLPRPISETSRAALVILMATSGLAVTRARKAAPADAVSPHCLRSNFKGVNNRSAPQCAAQAARPKTSTHSQLFIILSF